MKKPEPCIHPVIKHSGHLIILEKWGKHSCSQMPFVFYHSVNTRLSLLHLLNIKGIFKLKYIVLKSCTKNSVKKTGQDSSQNLTIQGPTRAANNRTNSMRAFEIDNECLNIKRQISLNLNNQNGALKKKSTRKSAAFSSISYTSNRHTIACTRANWPIIRLELIQISVARSDQKDFFFPHLYIWLERGTVRIKCLG